MSFTLNCSWCKTKFWVGEGFPDNEGPYCSEECAIGADIVANKAKK